MRYFLDWCHHNITSQSDKVLPDTKTVVCVSNQDSDVEEEEQVEEAKNTEQVDEVQEHPEGPQPPAVELLWVFTCKLNRGQSVNCMAWNKKNPVRRTPHLSTSNSKWFFLPGGFL